VSEFRWLLLAAGILLLAIVFWWSRREEAGRPLVRPELSRRRPPGLGEDLDAQSGRTAGTSGTPSGSQRDSALASPVIAVRLTAHGHATFSGEALVLALREAGLRHGRFGIFHRHDPKQEDRILFSVASLVEPGSFDLTRLKTDRFPGISLFLTPPPGGDCTAAFDEMLSTARNLAIKLNGDLLDEHGSRLSVQRERYLREEVIRLQHKLAPP
jgi:cell division protein ZipA